MMEFLSFQADSNSMELKLPGTKMKSISRNVGKVLASKEVTALAVSTILAGPEEAFCMWSGHNISIMVLSDTCTKPTKTRGLWGMLPKKIIYFVIYNY